MPDKTYRFKDRDVSITGTDELIAFIDELHTEYTGSQEALTTQPKLSEQLALWDKAKPFFTASNKEINYDLPAMDVMKTCLEGKYDVTDADEKTIKYLFDKVLTVEPSAPPEKSNDKTSSKQTPSKPPVVPNKPQQNGLSSEELSNAIAEKRLQGSLK